MSIRDPAEVEAALEKALQQRDEARSVARRMLNGYIYDTHDLYLLHPWLKEEKGDKPNDPR